MIELENVTKFYGKLKAVDSLSLKIPEGEIFGFIGPNGAGKTTTIKMLATLLLPSAGKITIGGINAEVQPREIRRLIGYMPDNFGVYPDLAVWEYLDFFADAYEVSAERRPSLINDVLELTDLSIKKYDLVETLSRGMKQRLCLAKTLLHDPAVLLLDEPAAGLDPRARIEIRELIKELGKMKKTVLISSHILPELSDFCTSIGIIEKGRLIVAGTLGQIEARLSAAKLYQVGCLDPMNELEAFLRQLGIESITMNNGYLQFESNRTEDEIANLLSSLVNNRFRITSFAPVAASLEDLFMKITRGEVA